MSEVNSPLRYPGGKTRALSQIREVLPRSSHSCVVDAMVGGGSVFLALKQAQPSLAGSFWMNDKYEPLARFWQATQDSRLNGEMCTWLQEAHRRVEGQPERARLLYEALLKKQNLGPGAEAARFFLLNRVTFSGLGLSGGFSPSASIARFTESAIGRVRQLVGVLKDVRITNRDVLDLIPEIPDDAFVFLDPPYLSVASPLYGRRGDLHAQFPHYEFAELLAEHSRRFHFLMTYDAAVLKNETLFPLLQQFKHRRWDLSYAMDSFACSRTKVGKELFFWNYTTTEWS